MKKNFLKKLFIILLSTFLAGCIATKKNAKLTDDKELQKFASLLIGNFNSKEQSELDSSYFNISLSATRIWEDRDDAIWLYVEQALASAIEKPYRQRVYKLNHPAKNMFTSAIYTIRGAERFIGLQTNPNKRNILSPEMIDLKDGCTVVLYKMNHVFRGGTQGNKCPSDLRGANFATTKITLQAGLLESWDQGFDSTGVQVWGPVRGGYRFKKE
jgi:hypothetical protein